MYCFAPDQTYAIPIKGEDVQFPIHRIFCVGRNYAAHAKEMGSEVDRTAPFYFTKTPSAMVLGGGALGGGASGGKRLAYPCGTKNYHHEIELAVMLGRPVFETDLKGASDAIYGYACALDMTRRDLQNAAKEKQRPWDLGKDFEQSAIFAPITKADAFVPDNQRIFLEVNGKIRQDSSLAEMVWKVDELIADLSHYYHLRAGDIILTGTPEGVGAVVAGDKLHGEIDGLDPLSIKLERSL